MNWGDILPILTLAIPFVAFFAALAGALIMYRVTQKFRGGILASGFKSIMIGILFISGGILIDAVTTDYWGIWSGAVGTGLMILKGVLFVIGTYVIVIGSKRMADRLESVNK